jgi:hypothetical protein
LPARLNALSAHSIASVAADTSLPSSFTSRRARADKLGAADLPGTEEA